MHTQRMDQNLPDRAGGSGPLAASGPADPPGPLDYAPQAPAYASLAPPGSAGQGRPPRRPASVARSPVRPPSQPRPAPSAFWDDQPGWDEQPDWDGGRRDHVSSATYWRRRAVALVIGMAVLGVIAWAVSGVLGGGRPATPPASPGITHGHSHGGAKNPSGSHAKGARHGRDHKAAGQHKAQAGGTAGMGPQHGANTAVATTAVTVPGSATPACAPGSVVLTLRSYCGDLAQLGSYTAVARDDHRRSRTMVFVPSGRDVAVS
jgi:hypothetical protein